MKSGIKIKNIDTGLITAALLLFIAGAASLYFMGDIDNVRGGYFFTRQLIWFGGAAIAVYLSFSLNYKLWERFSWLLYIINIVLLAGLLVFGSSEQGAESWVGMKFFNIQPSEFAKLLFTVTLAGFISRYRHELHRLPVMAAAFGLFLVPFLLTILQPDMGTAMIFAAIFVGMLLCGGMDGPVLLVSLTGFVSAGIALAPYVLKEYQFRRLLSFMNPESDPRGMGYQLLQSLIAIGSGGAFGRGVNGATQSARGFLPAAHSDFIFAAICEQAGLAGAIIIICLFTWFLFRITRIASKVEDTFAIYISCGLFCMFAFQCAVNIGMTVGLCPITGVPLPFVSYGGSSLLMNGVSIGLLLNIAARRRKIMFV